MLNYSDLYTRVGQMLERSDTGMQTKIKGFINDGLRNVVGKRPWMALLRPISFNAVANLDYFITEQNIDQIIDISQRQSPVVLSLSRYYNLLQRRLDVITSTGSPCNAAPAGEIGVKVALPSAGMLTVVSSSSVDTTQKVQIRGYSTALVAITEEVSLNGTSAVTSANSYSASEGYEPRFSKDANTTGIITIARSSTTVAEIAPLSREVRYKKWKVWPVFSSNLTMYATIKKRVYDLVNAEDVPELECDNCLILYAYARCLIEKRQISKANEIMGKKDIDGTFPPGTFGAELEDMIAREPQFSENFTDQFTPIVERSTIDQQGGTGPMLWPGAS